MQQPPLEQLSEQRPERADARNSNLKQIEYREASMIAFTSVILSQQKRWGAKQFSNAFASSAKEPLSTTTVGSSTNIRWHEGMVSTSAKEGLLRQRGAVLWFTGMPNDSCS